MTTSPGTSIHTQARLTGGPRLNVDDARCEALFASALQPWTHRPPKA